MKKSQIVILIVLLIVIIIRLSNFKLRVSNFHSEFEVGTDGYIHDSLAYVHPEWGDDHIEDYMFMDPDSFNKKWR